MQRQYKRFAWRFCTGISRGLRYPPSLPSINIIMGIILIFIGKEEKQLTTVFGKDYEQYLARVDRLVPFKKP